MNGLQRLVAAAAVLLVVACDAPSLTRPTPAYDPTTLTGGVLYHWVPGATVRVFVAGSGGARDLPLAVRQAIALWNPTRQFNEFTLEQTTSIADANIVIYERATAAPVGPGSCAFDARGAAGYTYFCPGSGTPKRAETLPLTGGGPSRATVIILVDAGRVDSQRAFNAVVAHEFGHALGIGAHSSTVTDLMFGSPSVEAPTARDVATLRYLLGQPADLTL